MLIHCAVCGIGLGHASRTLVVAEEIIAKGHEVSFSAYGQAVEYLVKHGFNPASVPSLKYGVGWDGGISVKQTIKNNITLPIKFMLQTAAELSIIVRIDPDLILSDTRASAILAAKILGKPVMTLLNQYNLLLETARYRRVARVAQRMLQVPSLIWNMSDKIVVPDLPPPYTISETTLMIPEKYLGKTFFIGPLVEKRPSSEEELEELGGRYGADDRPLILIVVSGGKADKQILIEKMLSIAKNLSNRFSYVLSMADPSSTGSKRIGPFYVHHWIEDIDRLMMAADVVVGRGGLTLISKCISYGKKMVLIPTPYHGEQIANAQKAHRLGICEKIDQSTLSSETFEETLSRVVEDKNMGRRVEHLQKLALGLGGAQKLVEMAESLVLNVS